MQHKNIFVVVTQIIQPQGRPTLEKCEVVSRVTNQHHTNATFIINASTEKVVKSRMLHTNFERLYEYFSKQFPKHANEVKTLLSKD